MLQSIRRLKTSRRLYDFIRAAWPVVRREPFSDNWHIGCIAEHLQAMTEGQLYKLVINAPMRHMKLCADSTVVPTPEGYRTHGEIGVGDLVFGADGAPAKVVGISAVGVADHEVRFSNGETVKCNGDHLWTVYDRLARKRKTLSTAEMMKLRPERGRHRFFVDDAPVLQYVGDGLLLHPYFLGCWLGDGTKNKPLITHGESDTAHIEKLAALGYRVTKQYRGSAVASEFCHQGISERLRLLGVFGDKHIPADYLTASEDRRLELLAGLIDTDGHVGKTGRVRISTCIERLAKDIRRLVVSLGFAACVVAADKPGYGKYAPTAGKVYQVCFQAWRDIPTAIPRKRIKRFVRGRRRAIVSIKWSANPEPGHCLTIDRDDGLYLVGETNLVTHNSMGACVFWTPWVWNREPHTNWVFGGNNGRLLGRDAGDTRDLVTSQWYADWFRPTWGLRDDTNAKHVFANTAGGSRVAVTVGDGIGENAHYSVLDDMNDPEDHRYNSRLDAVNFWFSNTIAMRGVDFNTYRQLIIQHRVAPNDVSGYVLAKDIGFEALVLPWEYEPRRVVRSFAEAKEKHVDAPIVPTSLQQRGVYPDPRKEPGEILWKSRFGGKITAELKKTAEGHGWASKGQQRPGAARGTIFERDRFRYFGLGHHKEYGRERCVLLYDLAAEVDRAFRLRDCRLFQTADTASKEERRSDYTAVPTFILTPEADLLVYDVWKAKIEITYQFAAMKLLHSGPVMWSPLARLLTSLGRWPIPSLFTAIEPKSSGIGLVQAGVAAGLPFKELPVDKDKLTRAVPLATALQQGKVFFLRGAAWLTDVEDELVAFPNSTNDDVADALGYGGYLRQHDVILRKYLEGALLLGPGDRPRDEYPRSPGDPGSDEPTAGERYTIRTGSGEVVRVDFDDAA